jgi:hypothetical protein
MCRLWPEARGRAKPGLNVGLSWLWARPGFWGGHLGYGNSAGPADWRVRLITSPTKGAMPAPS